MPDYVNRGSYKLKLLGGTRNRSTSIPIDENTMYDVASITKLYTLLLTFKLEEMELINLNDRVVDINPDFPGLEDFTFNDLIRLCGVLKTQGNMAKATSKDEAESILKTLYLEDNSRDKNTYTDFGAMVLSDTIAKIVSKYEGVSMSFDQVMDKYLFKPLGMQLSTFKPQTDNITGNERDDRKVHDPKARIFGSALGHAGLVIPSDDFIRLADALFTVSYVNWEHIKRLGEITFPDSRLSSKGNLGVYVKDDRGYDVTYTPLEFSTGSFSAEGWTGPTAIFDPNNKIHYSILVNSILKDREPEFIKADKPIGFLDAFQSYQVCITPDIMKMFVAREYFKFLDNDEKTQNIESTIRIGR